MLAASRSHDSGGRVDAAPSSKSVIRSHAVRTAPAARGRYCVASSSGSERPGEDVDELGRLPRRDRQALPEQRVEVGDRVTDRHNARRPRPEPVVATPPGHRLAEGARLAQHPARAQEPRPGRGARGCRRRRRSRRRRPVAGPIHRPTARWTNVRAPWGLASPPRVRGAVGKVSQNVPGVASGSSAVTVEYHWRTRCSVTSGADSPSSLGRLERAPMASTTRSASSTAPSTRTPTTRPASTRSSSKRDPQRRSTRSSSPSWTTLSTTCRGADQICRPRSRSGITRPSSKTRVPSLTVARQPPAASNRATTSGISSMRCRWARLSRLCSCPACATPGRGGASCPSVSMTVTSCPASEAGPRRERPCEPRAQDDRPQRGGAVRHAVSLCDAAGPVILVQMVATARMAAT